MNHNSTDALDALLNDDRFNQEISARLTDDNTADVPLFGGYEAEAREAITEEFGLEIADEVQMSGVRFATVVDPDGDESESVDTDMNADEAISMF